MKLAYNTWPYSSFPSWLPAYPLDNVIRRLAALGYDGIEIGAASPHAWPPYLDKQARADLLSLLRGEGISVSTLVPGIGGGPGLNPASPCELERDAACRHYTELIELASDLEAPAVIFCAGWIVNGTTRASGWGWSVDLLRRCAAAAERAGVMLAVEATPTYADVVESVDDVLRILEEVDSPAVGAMFDTYHALYREEPPADWIRRLADNLIHVHIADSDRLPPGDGSIDFELVVDACRDIGYDGWLAMEVSFGLRSPDPDTSARRSIQYMRRLLESEPHGAGVE
jgi:fructoselysine 3-epimerase